MISWRKLTEYYYLFTHIFCYHKQRHGSFKVCHLKYRNKLLLYQDCSGRPLYLHFHFRFLFHEKDLKFQRKTNAPHLHYTLLWCKAETFLILEYFVFKIKLNKPNFKLLKTVWLGQIYYDMIRLHAVSSSGI